MTIRKIWEDVKPIVQRILDAIKADPNVSNIIDVEQRLESITYRLENNFTPPQRAVLEPLRDELITNASLTADDQKQLIYWGVNTRNWIKSEWQCCVNNTVNIPEAKAMLEDYFDRVSADREISFQSAKEIITQSLQLIEEERNG